MKNAKKSAVWSASPRCFSIAGVWQSSLLVSFLSGEITDYSGSQQ